MRINLSPVFLGLALAACYRYVPAVASQPAVGDDVRLTLSTDATERLAPVLGASTRRLIGRILMDGGSELALAVDRTFKDDDVAVVWAGDRVTIPRSAIALIEWRVLDRRRTLMATGGVALSAIVSGLLVSRSKADAGNGGQGPPSPPPP